MINGHLSVGAFTAFYAYLLMLISPMQTLGYMLGAAQRATASGARIFEILDREPRIVSPPDAPPVPAGPGQITLRDVGLTFEGSTRPALTGIDLQIEGGQTVALVGAMGSGKSVLVSLLPRLYDVSTGSVSIDGADVRSVDVHNLRQQIAIVDDNPFLFSATIHENIAYAHAGASREDVVRAARAAQADGFIGRLPDGYDTHVGERGVTLSGGQRQRIAIARAILANPRILVLDDATSSVDASTEREIKTGLEQVMAGRTTIVIAHRLSTIALADRIVDARPRSRDRRRDARGAAGELGPVPGDRPQRHAGAHALQRAGDELMSATVAELRRRYKETGDGGRKLRALGELLAPYRWRVLAMCLSLLLATAAALAPAPLAKEAINQGIDQHDTGALYVIAGIFLISAVVYAVATYAQTYLVGWVGQRALQDLRMKLFAHLQSLSIGFYSRNIAGVVISRMTNDVEALDQLVEDGLATLIQSSLMLIGVIVILMVMDLHLALLTFIALPFLFAGALAFRIASAGAYRATREKIAAITGYLAESLSGIRAVRSFGQEQRHVDRFAELNDENRAVNMTTVKLNAAYFPAVELLSALVTVEILDRRRPGGDRRPHLDRRRVRVHRGAEQLLRPAAAALAALHDLPVGDGGTRQDPQPARRAARDRRCARRDHAAPDRGRGRVPRRLVPVRRQATTRRGRCATSTSSCRPGRRSRSSARPAPANRRSPSSSPVSMTRPRARCSSTATTCAT